MFTIQATVTVLGNQNLATLDDYYAYDMSVCGSEKWHNFGIYAKTAIAQNKMRDLKKESWDPTTQQYTVNMYSNTEADANTVLQELKDNNLWYESIENHETVFSVSEVIAAVSPLQVSGAVTISGNWWENPALDVNQ